MIFDPSTVGDLIAVSQGRPQPKAYVGPEVPDSDDLRRVLALPRRRLAIDNPIAAKYWTQKLRRKRTDPCACVATWGHCITDLNPVQGWALEEASQAGGLLASIGVGGGKTGIDLLVAMAIPGVRTAALMVPSNLRAQLLKRDYPQWSEHFQLPNLAGGSEFTIGRPVLHVISYPELSLPKNSDLLDRIDNLDLVIADECHALADPTSARTGRFLRSFQRRTKRLLSVNQSGTLTKREIKDCAHLSALALAEGSPFPVSSPVVESWGRALDAESFRNPVPAPPGALLKFAGEPEAGIEDEVSKTRAGFQRRLAETPGVIVTYDPNLPCSISIDERKLKMPQDLRAIIKTVQETSERPDGEELIEKIEVAATCNQLCSGFFYRWRYPRGESAEQIDAWFKARKAWRREVRAELNRAAKTDYDSPALIMRAAIRYFHGYHAPDPKNPTERIWFPPQTKNGPLPVFAASHWTEWERLHKTVQPVKDAVWLDEYMVRDSIAWAREHRGIVWYDHVEFADRLETIAKRERFDLPVFRGGNWANSNIILERGTRPIAASIAAHGEGKNLQHAFSENLIAHPPGSGKTWEQVIGRTHRPGQKADTVSVWVYRHHEILASSVSSAQNDARYIEELTGSKQRLNLANVGF